MKRLIPIMFLVTSCGYEVRSKTEVEREDKRTHEAQPAEDGSNCTVTQFGNETTEGQTAIIACEDGTQSTISVSNGRDGKDGTAGAKGDTGAQGPKGDKGDAGPAATGCSLERRNVKYSKHYVEYDVYVVCGDSAELISRNKEKLTTRN